MSRRKGVIDWSKLPNASPKPKKTSPRKRWIRWPFSLSSFRVQIWRFFLRSEDVEKHVKKKHLWFYYFDEKPNNNLKEDDTKHHQAVQQVNPEDSVRSVRSIPSFYNSNDIAKALISWLTGTGGGCKSPRQARQVVSRCLKYLKVLLRRWRRGHIFANGLCIVFSKSSV